MIPVVVGLEAAVVLFINVFSGLILQTELSEEEWYDNIESIILAATGVFSLL
jgi:hypothetical protein